MMEFILMNQDLTRSDVMSDPLISQLREADQIGNAAFAQLLESAARRQTSLMMDKLNQERADAFYRRLDIVCSKHKPS
jgi:hypothetical protein